MNNKKGQKLYNRAKIIIPGGTQLLSKRPELYAPGLWPAYASKAEGCRLWDLDGSEFLDMTTMGIGTCILGYANPVVNRAVKAAVDAGSMSSLNFAEEVELAELLLELNPWADMVRYARSGGEMLSQAVRIARAATGREVVAFCGYHGWHDWYLACNLQGEDGLSGHLLDGLKPAGVPRGLAGTILPFHYNVREELEEILENNAVAAIIMEPVRYREPEEGFLQHVRKRASQAGAVLIFDEVTAGWRHNIGGAHTLYGVTPDMAVYAKAMSNGVPCAAAVGVESVMEAAQETFISSTYWTERIGFAAALAAVREMLRLNLPERLAEAGKRMHCIWRESAKQANLSISIEGRPALTHFSFNHDHPGVLNTILTQRMLERGFLANTAFYASLAHTVDVIERYGENLEEVFGIIGDAVASGEPEKFLLGEVAMSGFSRLT